MKIEDILSNTCNLHLNFNNFESFVQYHCYTGAAFSLARYFKTFSKIFKLLTTLKIIADIFASFCCVFMDKVILAF